VGRLVYLDSSALVKLVLPEAESAALMQFLAGSLDRVTSSVAVVEVVRAARRASDDPGVERRAREVMAGVDLLQMNAPTLDVAAGVEPRALRSLDAIHLAAATELGDDLAAMVVYDAALAKAARAAGINVIAP